MSLDPFADSDLLGSRPTDADAALAGASAAVRAWAGWHIWPSLTETVTVDGSGGTALMLPTLHLTAVSDVRNDGQDVTGTVQWSRSGWLRLPRSWTSKLRGVTVTITHGHPGEAPAELAQVVMDAAAAGLALAGVAGVERVQAGPFSTSYRAADDLLSSAGRSLVTRYRLPPEA